MGSGVRISEERGERARHCRGVGTASKQAGDMLDHTSRLILVKSPHAGRDF